MQTFPDTVRTLGDVGLVRTPPMHLEVIVGAVAEELRAAGPEVGETALMVLSSRRNPETEAVFRSVAVEATEGRLAARTAIEPASCSLPQSIGRYLLGSA